MTLCIRKFSPARLSLPPAIVPFLRISDCINAVSLLSFRLEILPSIHFDVAGRIRFAPREQASFAVETAWLANKWAADVMFPGPETTMRPFDAVNPPLSAF